MQLICKYYANLCKLRDAKNRPSPLAILSGYGPDVVLSIYDVVKCFHYVVWFHHYVVRSCLCVVTSCHYIMMSWSRRCDEVSCLAFELLLLPRSISEVTSECAAPSDFRGHRKISPSDPDPGSNPLQSFQLRGYLIVATSCQLESSLL